MVILLAAVCVGFLGSKTSAEPKESDDKTGQTWIVTGEKHDSYVWKASIGSHSSTPIAYEHRIIVGTNNAEPRDAGVLNDRGVIMCFSQKDGSFEWQRTHARLTHRANDVPFTALGSPCIDNGKVYYQSNRGELICCDLVSSKLVWKLDYVADLGVFKRDAGDCGNPLPSPLVVDDSVYCVTGNGSTFGYGDEFSPLPYVPQPKAPSFIAVNKRTGAIIWSSSVPGMRIAYAQWGSPSKVQIGGKTRIIFPGGDGCLYMFEHLNGELIGKVDCNVGKPGPWTSKKRGESVFFICSPTIMEQTAYVGLNQDMETPQEVRCPVVAVDLKRLSEGQEGVMRWSYTDKAFDGVVGPVAVGKQCVYAMSKSGLLVALDRNTGKESWRRKFNGTARFGGPVVQGEKLYAPADDSLWVFTAGREPKAVGHYVFDQLLYGSPVVSAPTLLVSSGGYLWCLRQQD